MQAPTKFNRLVDLAVKLTGLFFLLLIFSVLMYSDVTPYPPQMTIVFYLIVIIPPVSIILSLLGLSQINKNQEQGKFYAIGALVLFSVILIMLLIYFTDNIFTRLF